MQYCGGILDTSQLKHRQKIMDREEAEIPADVEYRKIPKLKYAPITFVDAEKSFSD
jgi:hypothetical protein